MRYGLLHLQQVYQTQVKFKHQMSGEALIVCISFSPVRKISLKRQET